MNYPWFKQANNIFAGVLIFQWAAAIVIGIFTDTLLIGCNTGNTYCCFTPYSDKGKPL